MLNRRTALALATASAASFARAARAAEDDFSFRYVLASCMYGYASLDDILPQVKRTGAEGIDLWPKVHGNQREQLDEIGEAAFKKQLQKNGAKLSCITQYKLGPFGLDDEIRLAGRLGCPTIVTGGKGPKNLSGGELKSAVRQFLKQLAPTLNLARDNGVVIAIENHHNNLIHDADSLRYLADLAPRESLGIALAPYHLPQKPTEIATLIKELGGTIRVFYAWQHGMGCMEKLPKQQELLQMPGRGDLDFRPLVAALKEIDYRGTTEIFMHPVPRGVPILDQTSEVTDEINRARTYLSKCLAASPPQTSGQ